MSKRIVIDTNVYVSRLLNPLSVPGRAVAKALEEATTLVSLATLAELKAVLGRSKLVSYIPPGSVEPFLEAVMSVAIFVEVITPIHACRDPRDDKFLEVAVHGRADVIVTGDADLAVSGPWKRVLIGIAQSF